VAIVIQRATATLQKTLKIDTKRENYGHQVQAHHFLGHLFGGYTKRGWTSEGPRPRITPFFNIGLPIGGEGKKPRIPSQGIRGQSQRNKGTSFIAKWEGNPQWAQNLAAGP